MSISKMERKDAMEAEANGEVKNSTSSNQEKQHEEVVLKDHQNSTKKHGDQHDDHDHDQQQKQQPPLMALNHVSRLCRNVDESIDFYTKILGFVLIKRPPAFDFDGAWLFNYGVGIHLVESKDKDKLPETHELDPMDNHISFQCENMKAMEEKLKEHNIKYIKRTVEDDKNGTSIDQLFFKDPDGFMCEICNCENLKLVPAGSLGKLKLPFDRHNPPVELDREKKDQK